VAALAVSPHRTTAEVDKARKFNAFFAILVNGANFRAYLRTGI
jgi:hypothetical protein